MSASMPSIGHNNAPGTPTPQEVEESLRDQFTQLAARSAALADSLSRFISTYPTIETEAVQKLAAEVVRQVKAHARIVDAKRTEAKAPYLEGGRVVDGWFRQISGRLADVVKVESAMTVYARKVEAERRRAAEEAARLAREEAARKAALAVVIDTEGAQAAAEEAAVTAASAAEATLVKPAEISRVHGEYGAVASLAETWDFAIEDIREVPTIYLRVDEVAVRRAIRHDKVRAIPGLRIFSSKSVRVR